jgi:hypothetical protein
MPTLKPGHPRYPIHRREHHVITFRWASGHVKLFRLQFHARQLFVNFPYQPDAIGLHARCQVDAGEQATIDLSEEGRTTKNKIKYSHPIDGNCHFSQDGKIITQIRNVGPRLDDGVTHLFTVDLQGLDRFASFGSAKKGEAYVTFYDAAEDPPKQLHVAARWMPLAAEEIGQHMNPLEIEVPVPGGYRGVFMACAPPSDSPLAGHLLLLEVHSVVPLAVESDFLLLFVGAFGADLVDPSRSSDFLFLQYPTSEGIGMESADIVRELVAADR